MESTRVTNSAADVRTAQACNLLRPLAELMDGPVLEVGSHRGALTSYLEEHAPAVTSCEDLDNISSDARFKLIIFVDVLRGPGAAGRLARARNLLAENGFIFIAASNRLRSAEEDLRDLREWRDLLGECGMETGAVLYPFPDHRSPAMLLTDRAWRDPRLNIATLLGGCAGGDGLWQEFPWADLVENGAGEELANSFAIVANRRGSGAPRLDPSCLVYHYSMARLPAFQKQTSILAESGRLMVRRRRFHPEAAEHHGYAHQLEDEPYLAGPLYSDLLLERLRVEGWRVEALAEWAGCWLDYLRAHERQGAEGVAELPARFLDCVPFNLVLTSAGKLQPIDIEYIPRESPPLDFVAFRGMWLSLARARTVAQGEALREWTLAGLTFAILDAAGIRIAPERRERLIELEADFQHALTGVDRVQVRNSLAGIRLAGRPPTVPIESQIFWRGFTNEFTEQDSGKMRTGTCAGPTTLRLHIPGRMEELAQLRLDIADRPGLVRLRRLRLVDEPGAPIWEWDGRAATLSASPHAQMDFVALPLSGGAIVHLAGNDPRLVLPIAAAQLAYLRNGGYVEVEFAWLA